jgi:hypothetical protein
MNVSQIETIDVEYINKKEPSVIRQGRVAFVSEQELSLITSLSDSFAPEASDIRKFDSKVWLYVTDNEPSWSELTDENNEYHFVIRKRKES